MPIFSRPPRAKGTPQETGSDIWALRHVAYDENEKKKLLEEANGVENEIFELLATEMRAAWNKTPNAEKIEVTYSKELKTLLLEQAEWLEKAAKAARKEAKLENIIYRIKKYRSY